MLKQRVLASGKFYPKDLIVTCNASNRKLDPHVESQLDKLWLKKVEDAKSKGKNIYNGFSYRLNSLEQHINELKIDFGQFDFKTRECLIEADGYFQLSEDYYRKGCHTLGTVKTADSKYLMVEMSGKSMNTNAVDFLGGIMETNIEMKSGKSIFQAFQVELEEEGCIGAEDIQDIYLVLIYLSANTNVGFYFEVTLNITAKDLQKRFLELSTDKDIKSLRIFSRDEYMDTLRNHNINKQFVRNYITI